jgi:predicted transcriptional regulator
MSLPILPKKNPRPVAVTVRLSKEAVNQLKELADAHNMSQADIVEHLLAIEHDAYKKRSKKGEGRR